ncbi:hypothetical protein KB093_001673, partial [Campylobacter jejuni]|nr:hypothetical protein [Campylobacter jejuni]
MKILNIVLLGGSNSVMVNGLSAGLSQKHVKLTNLALGATSCLQNLYELKRIRNQEIIDKADLIITESNVNDAFLSDEYLFENLSYFYRELYLTKKKVLVIILPFYHLNYTKTNNLHRILTKKYGFNIIDLDLYYVHFNLNHFANLRDGGGHQFDFIMRELGKNIIFHYEKLKDSDISFDEIDNVKYDFKICYSNELVGNKNNKIINLSNSKYNENIVRFNIGDSIKFPKAYTGYTIIGIHTWNTSKNTQLNLPKDWLQRRKIKVSLKFNSNNQDICLDNIFTDVRIKITDNLTIFIEESKETSVKFSYCDIVSFFLLKNTNDELYFDEKYFKDDIERDKIAIRKKYNCNYLIPPIKFYKEIIDEYCAIMDPRKLKLSQEQVNILSCSDREKYQFDFKYKTAKARIHNRLSYKIGQAL